METIELKGARRLALARAGLLRTELSGLPARASGRGKRARAAMLAVISRFGYLQLDTISVVGTRTQGIVLSSRLDGLDATLAEELLKPGGPYFEYWGHEACWMPLELYPYFEFRRVEFRAHPWWGNLLGQHRAEADKLLKRVTAEGPLRSMDLEAPADHRPSKEGWWETKLSKRIAEALWSAGELAIRERRNFQRSYDLPDRVIPSELRNQPVSVEDALDHLLLRALDGHGWATTGTLAATWRLRNRRPAILASLARLCEADVIRRCELQVKGGRIDGWIKTEHLDTIDRLREARLHANRPVLLSPFDPVLWDRDRVRLFFGFDQVLEIYKPKTRRQYGYYCLPVLAGEKLVGRVDLKADRQAGRLGIQACHRERTGRAGSTALVDEQIRQAIERFAAAVGLEPDALRV